MKLPPRKVEPWFTLWSFFLLRWLCISINVPYSITWNTVVMSGLVLLAVTWEFLDKLQKRICITVGPSLAGILVPLPHFQNVASLSLFYRHYFGRCSSEMARLVPLPYFFEGGLLVSRINWMVFLSLFLDVTRMSTLKVSLFIQLDSGIFYL